MTPSTGASVRLVALQLAGRAVGCSGLVTAGVLAALHAPEFLPWLFALAVIGPVAAWFVSQRITVSGARSRVGAPAAVSSPAIAPERSAIRCILVDEAISIEARTELADALLHAGMPGTAQEFVQFASDPQIDPLIRLELAEGLARQGRPEALSALAALAGADELPGEIRLEAVGAMLELHEEDGLQALLRLARTELVGIAIQFEAAFLVHEVEGPEGGRAVTIFARFANDRDVPVAFRRIAIDYLLSHDPERGTNALWVLCNETQHPPVLRIELVEKLEDIDPVLAATGYRLAVHNDDFRWADRLLAAYRLKRLREQDGRNALGYLLEREDADEWVKFQIIKTLACLDN